MIILDTQPADHDLGEALPVFTPFKGPLMSRYQASGGIPGGASDPGRYYTLGQLPIAPSIPLSQIPLTQMPSPILSAPTHSSKFDTITGLIAAGLDTFRAVKGQPPYYVSPQQQYEQQLLQQQLLQQQQQQYLLQQQQPGGGGGGGGGIHFDKDGNLNLGGNLSLSPTTLLLIAVGGWLLFREPPRRGARG